MDEPHETIIFISEIDQSFLKRCNVLSMSVVYKLAFENIITLNIIDS